MNIYVLTEQNLRNNVFVKDFAFYFKPKGKAVLLHAGFGSPSDTRFVTKRLSAYLSEELVVNAQLNGDQRGLIYQTDTSAGVRRELLDAGFLQVDLLVMNDLCLMDGDLRHVGLVSVLDGLRAGYPDARITLFPANPLSALGQRAPGIFSAEQAQRLIDVYDEEQSLLELAALITPVHVLNPSAFQNV